MHALTGLITVLDDTPQISGLYPQLVQSLVERGVLLAIANKNDAAFGEQAMGRTGLLLRRSIFSCRGSLGTEVDFGRAHLKSLEHWRGSRHVDHEILRMRIPESTGVFHTDFEARGHPLPHAMEEVSTHV